MNKIIFQVCTSITCYASLSNQRVTWCGPREQVFDFHCSGAERMVWCACYIQRVHSWLIWIWQFYWMWHEFFSIKIDDKAIFFVPRNLICVPFTYFDIQFLLCSPHKIIFLRRTIQFPMPKIQCQSACPNLISSAGEYVSFVCGIQVHQFDFSTQCESMFAFSHVLNAF